MSEIVHKDSNASEHVAAEQPDPDDSSIFKNLEQFTSKNISSVSHSLI